MSTEAQAAPNRWDWFISHVGADHAAAVALREAFTRVAPNARVFLAKNDALPGVSFAHDLDDALGVASGLLLLVSRHSTRGTWVPAEIARASARTPPVPIIPLLLDGATSDHIPLGANQNTAIEVHDLDFVTVVKRILHSAPDGAAADSSFVGRTRDLERVEAALLSPRSHRRCAIIGMPGIGKTSLAEHFVALHRREFPQGACRLWVRPEGVTTERILEDLAELLDLRVAPAERARAISARLSTPPSLLLLENIDDEAEARAVAGLNEALRSVAILITGRWSNMGRALPWTVVEIGPMPREDALTMLEREHRPARSPAEREAVEVLLTRLHGLPLAIHLVAGWLREDGDLATLGNIFHMAPTDTLDPLGADQPGRATLALAFNLSLERLAARNNGERLLSGLRALGHAPLAGFGPSLGAAISGLDAGEYEELRRHATRLSLLAPNRERRDTDKAVQLHPLLAEWLTESVPRKESKAVRGRIDAWFRERTRSAPNALRDRIWSEARAEAAGLGEWLAWERKPSQAAAVLENSHAFANASGPYEAWARLCELAADPSCAVLQRSRALSARAWLLLVAGHTDRALEAAKDSCIFEESRPGTPYLARSVCTLANAYAGQGHVARALDLLRTRALPAARQAQDSGVELMALRRIVALLKQTGRVAEALALLEREVLPRSREAIDVETAMAIAQRIQAELLSTMGRRAEAERLLVEEVIPSARRRSDHRGEAVTGRALGDVLVAAGRNAEALEHLERYALPLADELGDPRGRATAQISMARALLGLGRMVEARALALEVQPATIRIHDLRGQAAVWNVLADVCVAEGNGADAERILRDHVLPLQREMHNTYWEGVTLAQIGALTAARGALPEAIALLRRALERFPEAADLPRAVLAQRDLALALRAAGGGGARGEAVQRLRHAARDARRLQLPEAAAIDKLLEEWSTKDRG